MTDVITRIITENTKFCFRKCFTHMNRNVHFIVKYFSFFMLRYQYLYFSIKDLFFEQTDQTNFN